MRVCFLFCFSILLYLLNSTYSSELPGGHVTTESLLVPAELASYTSLRNSSTGRHLLLISLLEHVHTPYWYPRCSGYIQLFLPPSLAPADQPQRVATALVLEEIILPDGSTMNRSQAVQIFNDIENVLIWPENQMSRFDKYHMTVVHRLVTFFTSQPSFNSLFTFMVVFKEFLSVEMFVDSVYQVIQKRNDVGFVIPSLLSVQPEDFFPGAFFEAMAEEINKSSNRRSKRQARTWEVEVAWNKGEYRTMPDWEPEGKIWYFNEDPLVNANHFHWHQVLSNNGTNRSRYHSSHLDRRGEMFIFMHRQMLARLNNERLSVGLDLVRPFGPDRWGQPVYPGYDPKLHRPGSVKRFALRPGGATLLPLWKQELEAQLARLREAIERGVIDVGGSRVAMGYRNGRDMGISVLGDIVESYIPNKYGDLHNLGHAVIANLHKGPGEGVMNSPSVAVRDPLFGQWHKFIDDEILKYKRKLGHYQNEDLDFPGVTITGLSLQSVSSEVSNSLTTFLVNASVRLNSLDLVSDGTRPVLIRYERLNHVLFTYNISVYCAQPSTRGMIRIFLIPANVPISPSMDVTQLAIEMDRFHVSLSRGSNIISRSSSESPFVAKNRDSVFELQSKLLRGTISEDQFNWGGCGWPKEMTLPRGSEFGTLFRVFLVLSPLLESDSAHTADWRGFRQHSWSWCGVRKDKGGMPDSRPMGFPFDRPPPSNTWRSLMYRSDGSWRLNMAYTNITITFLPDLWG